MARYFAPFRPCSFALATGFAVWALLEAPVAAQQLISDGDFDGTLGSWDTNDSNVSLTLGTIDATQCDPESVAARAESSSPTASVSHTFFHACIPGIVAGQTYSFGGFIRFTNGQATTGDALFMVSWFTACNGNNVGTAFSETFVTEADAGTWVESRTAVEAPAGAATADLRFRLVKDDAGGTLVALFDRVFFAPGDLVFFDDFEIHDTCRWGTQP